VQTLINKNKHGEEISKAVEQMIKAVHDNLYDGGGPKITELTNKFAALTFSITERFKINDELRAVPKAPA
jgi:hypothetical protein